MEKNSVKKAAAKKKTAVEKEVEIKISVAGAAAKPGKKLPSLIRRGGGEADGVVEKPRPAKARGPVKPVKALSEKPAKKTVKKMTNPENTDLDATAEIAAAEPAIELSPVFQALADVSLPALKRENRARLQMQTPTRLYFYWSVKENPYHLLKRAFGDDMGSYTLVLKFTDLQTGVEQIHPAEAEGTWWFDVEPDSEYQAEIGFYAPNRPYFRIVYSNTVSTPRRSPSTHPATEARWTVSANKFAEVLDVAGFSRDAFDVAMAGDDFYASDRATHGAFSSFAGPDHDLSGVSAEDIRYVLIALASGVPLADLRSKISPTLFAVLQANAASIESGKAMSALTEYFDIDEAEFVEEHLGSAVYGASLVNFPRTLKTRPLSSAKYSPRYNPVSSHSFR
ncbi:MAG: DUF4912 domain-containing protein [Pyrinomonadaceae bacterium]